MAGNNDYVISSGVTVTMNDGEVRMIHCVMGNESIKIGVDSNGYVDSDSFGEYWSVSIDDLPDQLDRIADQIRKVNEFRHRYDKAVAKVAGEISKAMRDADHDADPAIVDDGGICDESETWYCSFCRKEVPDDDMTQCEECGIDVCRNCIAECFCGDKVCPDCLTKNRRLADDSVKGGDE
ncbi:hypothetical protein [uncultured Bifidobacterium sp.]|uniref:hypothetical protein n=1 Tax=uncultured Bifidobacterium sp. TaxID=165187 RepID=UPI002593DA94|nr:hypothetical protein [uncultured Bifidobacterium sp.]